MNRIQGIVLTTAALALLATGGWLRRSVSAPAEPRAVAPAAPTPVAPAPALTMESRGEANQVLDIAQLLGGPRQPAELFRSRQREGQDLAGRLCKTLKVNPGAWKDVFDLLCCLGDVDAALRIAELLQDAVDVDLEGRLAQVLRSEANPQARRVALTLLGGRKTSDSFVALQVAVEDADPRIRQTALPALNRRRSENPGVVTAILERRARVETDPVLRDTAKILLGEKVPPRGAPPAPQKSALTLHLHKPAK